MKNIAEKILCCMLVMFVAAALSGGCEKAASSFAPVSQPSVNIKCITVSDKYVDIKLSYPEVSSLADGAFQAQFNKSVLAGMRTQASLLELNAKAYFDSANKGHFPFWKCTLTSAVNVYENNGIVLSMSIRMENYAGGAHGNSDSRFYTLLNLPAAKQLTLLNLFTKPDAGIVQVEKYIKDDIVAQHDYFFANPAIALDASTWFYVTDTKLHIVFPTYSIAPYVTGEPDFSMPLSSFKNILIPEIRH